MEGAQSLTQYSAAAASEQMQPQYCGVNCTQHDIVLVKSLEATVSSFENMWKSKFIWGPLHPSGMTYKMCSSLICLKTAKEACFRLFYYPALKYTLCLPILLGEGGFSAKVPVVRALRSAEAAMPLKGDNLPRYCAA